MIPVDRTATLSHFRGLSPSALDEVVRRVLENDSAKVLPKFSVNSIGKSVGIGTLGIFKFSGVAKTDSAHEEWSVIAKVIDKSASSESLDHISPAREVQAYESGLLGSIGHESQIRPEPRAAKHFAVEKSPELGTIIWLEELGDPIPAPWDDATYIEVARQVGHLNASWALDPPSHQDWFYEDVSDATKISGLDRLQSFKDHLDDPVVAVTATPEYSEVMEALQARLRSVYSELKNAPKSLAHLDLQPRNVFSTDTDNGLNLVLIDWASIGYERLGADAVLLVGSSLTWVDISAQRGTDLHPKVLNAYLRGLEEVGWHGDVDIVRLNYMTAAVTRAASNSLFPVMWANEPEWIPTMQKWMSATAEEMAHHYRDALLRIYGLFDEEAEAFGL